MAEINDVFEKLKEERSKIQESIEGVLNKGKGSEIGKLRDSMKALRDKKGALINEKKAIRAQLDSLKAAGDKLVKDRKDQRSSVKFSSPEEIDKEVAKLKRLQETTSMSLSDEKKLIKEKGDSASQSANGQASSNGTGGSKGIAQNNGATNGYSRRNPPRIMQERPYGRVCKDSRADHGIRLSISRDDKSALFDRR